MRTDSLDMTGRTVIVTGATAGLGRVIASRFLGPIPARAQRRESSAPQVCEVPSYLTVSTGEVAQYRPGPKS